MNLNYETTGFEDIRFYDYESLPRTAPDSLAMRNVQLRRKEHRLESLRKEISILQKEEEDLLASIARLRNGLNLEIR